MVPENQFIIAGLCFAPGPHQGPKAGPWTPPVIRMVTKWAGLNFIATAAYKPQSAPGR